MAETLNQIIWSDVTLLLLLGTGLYFTVRSRCWQAKHLLRGLRGLFGGSGGTGGLSQLQTTATTLAATMGTGNLVGVATALTIGGAGAIFWMWVSAFLGMALVYAENVLGARYRVRNPDGSWLGGPMAYLSRGVGSRALALLFAACCVLASLGMGNMVQTNAMADALETALRLPPWVCGLACAVLLAVVLRGGVPRVGRAATALIPPLAVCYLLGAAAVLVLRCDRLPAAFSEIFQSAFGLSAAGGGIAGAAVRRCVNIGLRRGVFSNEAGLGSSPLLHSSVADGDPARQGACAMAEVFLDTMVCCTLTALVLLTTGATESGTDGAPMLQTAFASCFGAAGVWFVTAAVGLFALATLIGWSCCGLCAAKYLSPRYGAKIYGVVYPAACLLGAVASLQTIWSLSDCCNGLMLLPNLLGLLLLRNVTFSGHEKNEACNSPQNMV